MQLTLDYPDKIAQYLIEQADKEKISVMDVISQIVEADQKRRRRAEYEKEMKDLGPIAAEMGIHTMEDLNREVKELRNEIHQDYWK